MSKVSKNVNDEKNEDGKVGHSPYGLKKSTRSQKRIALLSKMFKLQQQSYGRN